MKKLINISYVMTAALILAGCGATSSSDDPELNSFEIRDESDADSAKDTQFRLSPSRNDGEFELYWEIDSDDDYSYEVRLNDDNEVNGSIRLFSEFCEENKSCDKSQQLDCEYQSDMEIICENSKGDEETTDIRGVTGIGEDLEDELPEDLYFILKTCDPFGFDCEDQSLKVRFEE